MAGEVPSKRCGSSMPAWVKPHVAQRLCCAMTLHEEAGRDLRGFVCRVVLTGLHLATVKREVGHGRWLALQEHVLAPQMGVSDRQLRRYLGVAAAVRKALEQRGATDILDMLDGGSLGPADVDRVGQALGTCTAADTWQELLADFGLAKEQERGGFHPPRALLDAFATLHGLPLPGVYADWPADVQERFRAWLKAEGEAAADAEREERERRKAHKRWEPLLAAAAQADRNRHQLVALPKPTRVAMRDSLKRVLDAVEQSLQEGAA